MNNNQWKYFCDFRREFNQKVQEWSSQIPGLRDLQKNAADAAGTTSYPVENPVVYNSDLDKITKDDEIKLIVIGDNPGKSEQLEQNKRYLCGQAGKLAEGFFKNHPELGIDFRKNVIILNKTPVHSAKTNQLKSIIKEGGPLADKLILDSQKWMAEQTAELHKALGEVELWLVGYSELKEGHFFCPYRDTLKEAYKGAAEAWNKVFVYQHFSMNRFTVDLKDFEKQNPGCSLTEKLHKLGTIHRGEIFLD